MTADLEVITKNIVTDISPVPTYLPKSFLYSFPPSPSIFLFCISQTSDTLFSLHFVYLDRSLRVSLYMGKNNQMKVQFVAMSNGIPI